MPNLILEAYPGDNYSEVAKKAKKLAGEDDTVEFDFNGIINLVTKDTDLDLLYRDYSNSFTMDWETVGPICALEYSEETQNALDKKRKAQERKQKAAYKKIEAKEKKEKETLEVKTVDVTLEIIPERIDEYNEYVKINSQDGYSKAVIEYGEAWAKLMQIEIAKGRTIQEMGDETQKGVNYLGITGFQYGCVVRGLSHFWKHGEELRKWHNKDYGHEGEGVVNPAVFSIQ